MKKVLGPDAAGRAIKYAGVLGGMTREEINQMLRAVGLKELPASSFAMIAKNEVAVFQDDLTELGGWIRSPKAALDVHRSAD